MQMTPLLAYSLTFFPFGMLSVLTQGIFTAQSRGVELGFGNLFSYDIVPRVSMGGLLLAALGYSLIWFSLLLYIWPIKIQADSENPYKWHYPCTCKCFRRRRPTVEDSDNDHNETRTSLDDLNEEDKDDGLGQLLLRPNKSRESNFENSDRVTRIAESNPYLSPEEHELIQNNMYEPCKDVTNPDRLMIRNLVKKYGKKTAVNELSLTIFKDEILVLLGHNGAGKTTTISMLTGVEKATGG